jgi:hypothetical protein
MTRRKVTTRDLNPFEFMWMDGRLKKVHTAWGLLLGVLVVAAPIVVSAAEGAFGGPGDVQLWSDLRRALGAQVAVPSPPRFPFMRDVTSWFLAGTVVVGTLLLHRQWQYMSTCLSRLARNGVILHRVQPSHNLVSKLLGIDRITRRAAPQDALNAFVSRVSAYLERKGKYVSLVMLVAAFVLALLLVFGWRSSVFQVLAPSGYGAAQRDAWAHSAYRSWWAGEDHVAGFIVYLLIAVYAIFIILSTQFVGLVAIYVTIGMHFLVEPSADWLNRDGRFGWAPLARVYRTVVAANVVLGVTLSVVVLSLGIGNFAWIEALVVLYVVLMPLFSIVPWLAFRSAKDNAVRLRVAEIEQVIVDRELDEETDIEALAPLVAEIERCRSAHVRPLRVRTVSAFSYVVLVVLPIVLALAQILFPLAFGPHR